MSEQRGPGRRSDHAHFHLHRSGETRPADKGVERIRTGEWPWGHEMRGWWRVAVVWEGGLLPLVGDGGGGSRCVVGL